MRQRALLALLVVVAASSSLIAAPHSGERVRAFDRRVLTAIADGKTRSATFRNVLARVEALDVIVYVEMQPHLGSGLAGALTWVAKTNDFRYLRIGLNPALTGGPLVATLAHELQHAAEVGEAPSIVDEQSLSTYYREIGDQSPPSRRQSDRWETDAARRTGALVRREFALGPGARVADSIRAADETWVLQPQNQE